MATMGEQIAAEISEIISDRDKIRNKLIEIGEADSTANLSTLATAIAALNDNGAVNADVKEGETYTIPKGFHNGSGTVKGVSGGGNYSLQAKTVTPTKAQQNVTPDSGYYGMSSVTVGAIPAAYQDVSSVTAEAADVLANKTIVTPDGALTAGTMPNNGKVTKTIDASTKSYAIPKGYHDGTGSVGLVTEEKSATPTKAEQSVTPTSGKVLSKVTVAAIPDEYITTDDATATAAQIVRGATAYVDGEKITGSMTEWGDISMTFDPETPSMTFGEGHITGGTLGVDFETKAATPTKTSQTIHPSSGKVLRSVTVSGIPEEYQDVTGVTATADKVLAGSVFVNSFGNEVDGTMPDNGEINLTIDALSTTSASIPAGYTTGGTVSLTDDLLNRLKAI